MSKIDISLHGPVIEHHPVYPVVHSGHLSRVVARSAFWLFGISLLVIALQLAYPRGRALPRASFGGVSYGLAAKDNIVKNLQALNSSKFKASASVTSYNVALEEIGLAVDAGLIADDLADYPLNKRLLPLSFLFYKPSVAGKQIVVTDEIKLAEFAKKVAAENNREPVEGTLDIKDGKVKAVYSAPGISYRAEDIAGYFSVFSNQTLSAAATIPYSSVQPVNSREHLDNLADDAETLVNKDFPLSYGDGVYELPSAALASSISIEYDKAGKATLGFDEETLLPELEDLANTVFVPPASPAALGQELDVEKTVKELVRALNGGAESSKAVLKPLGPDSAGRKLYPATSKGLQQLIGDWRDSHASLGLSIDFSEVAGMRRHAEINADEPYFSASVYKVYVAWFLLRMVEEGKLTTASTIVNGWDLPTCLEKMIVISESKCSEGSVYKYTSWEGIDNMASKAGIQGIALSKGVSITANGMAQFLQKLDAGELMKPEGTKTLLDLMKRQKYRQAIPAGSSGEVADKVGYQPQSYSWHDAAMVYHPKAKYTLVILTRQGASLYTLSDLARQISNTLER